LKDEIIAKLEKRLGRLHARLRLGVEADHEAQVFGQGINYFHFENLPWSHAVIRVCLIVAGIYGRGRRNAARVDVKTNDIRSKKIPAVFDEYTVLQLSDLHADMSEEAMKCIQAILPGLQYDICVLTGDYRAHTFGPYEPALESISRVCSKISKPVYGVLGNHDTIRMLPELEQMGIQMLLNECVVIQRDSARIHLAGIDDAHFYRADNIEKAASDIPPQEFSILLSHTPEVYQQAAHAEFDVLLSGHTHGGQICLPGGIPITLDSVLPRHMGSGAWTYHEMQGYTSVGAGSSVVPARFNCPPEITLHRLRAMSRLSPRKDERGYAV